MKPLCFVLMPFGRKPDGTGRTIDFDEVYRNVIAPAVEAAGLEVIRADEEVVGGSIHRPMFERLILCEYAVADLTGANPNVYYELGVRHALRPRSTIILFSEGTALPFDVAPLRGMPYRLDADGLPVDAEVASAAIGTRLKALREQHSDDSPVFQLIEGIPRFELDHERADAFRGRANYSRKLKDRLAAARRAPDAAAAVHAVAADPDLADISALEAGIVVDLFLSYRAVKAHDAMVALFEHMTPPLQHTRIIQEQLGFALNRLGRRKDAQIVLERVLAEQGPSSETYGLLGRVFKDHWADNVEAGDRGEAQANLQFAIDTYYKGFETDLRDPYPGINALNLMQQLDETDPREAMIAPVVLYAATRRAQMDKADYWDFATLLEAAAIKGDAKAATNALYKALPRVRESWEPETTVNNLRLLRAKRTQQGHETGWIVQIEEDLTKRAAKIAAGG